MNELLADIQIRVDGDVHAEIDRKRTAMLSNGATAVSMNQALRALLIERGCLLPEDLVGIAGIAERARKSISAVWKWRKDSTAPQAIAELNGGEVWDWKEWEQWLATRRGPGRPWPKKEGE